MGGALQKWRANKRSSHAFLQLKVFTEFGGSTISATTKGITTFKTLAESVDDGSAASNPYRRARKCMYACRNDIDIMPCVCSRQRLRRPVLDGSSTPTIGLRSGSVCSSGINWIKAARHARASARILNSISIASRWSLFPASTREASTAFHMLYNLDKRCFAPIQSVSRISIDRNINHAADRLCWSPWAARSLAAESVLNVSACGAPN
mmetsp:Transcript_44526/g.131438  ORF Transcript_44526/g.131438 Transcript_44526/m.131438 type:complete len:208 (+) Transcript_44526:4498-5121(+)